MKAKNMFLIILGLLMTGAANAASSDRLEVLRVDREWRVIRTAKGIERVRNDHYTKIESEKDSAVITRSTSLRSGGGLSWSAVKDIGPGTKIREILYRGQFWNKVVTEDGRSGWIRKEAMSTAAVASVNRSTSESSTARFNPARSAVESSPASQAGCVGCAAQAKESAPIDKSKLDVLEITPYLDNLAAASKAAPAREPEKKAREIAQEPVKQQVPKPVEEKTVTVEDADRWFSPLGKSRGCSIGSQFGMRHHPIRNFRTMHRVSWSIHWRKSILHLRQKYERYTTSCFIRSLLKRRRYDLDWAKHKHVSFDPPRSLR